MYLGIFFKINALIENDTVKENTVVTKSIERILKKKS